MNTDGQQAMGNNVEPSLLGSTEAPERRQPSKLGSTAARSGSLSVPVCSRRWLLDFCNHMDRVVGVSA